MPRYTCGVSFVEPFILTLGVLIAAEWARRGYLGPGGLAGGPDRRGVLLPVDLVVGIAGLLPGAAAMAYLAERAWPWMRDTESPTAYVARMLAGHAGFLPVLVYLLIRLGPSRQKLASFGLWSEHRQRDLRTGLAALGATLPVVAAVMVATTLVSTRLGYPSEPLAHEMLKLIDKVDQPWVLAVMVLAAVVLAPVFEEIFFRGLVQTALLDLVSLGGKPRHWTALLLASVGFTLLHVSTVAWQALPGLFCLALVLGWLYERSGSLWPSILLHMGFNAANFALAWWVPRPPGTGLG